MAKFHSLQYDDDIRLQPILLGLLVEAAEAAGYETFVTRGPMGHVECATVLDKETKQASAPGALFFNNLIGKRKNWCW
jgi:hypothetical protein